MNKEFLAKKEDINELKTNIKNLQDDILINLVFIKRRNNYCR